MTCNQCNGLGKVKKLSKKLNGKVVEKLVKCKMCKGTGEKQEIKRKQSDLHKELMGYFKKWVRLNGADKDTGIVECYTCGVKLPIMVLGNRGWHLNAKIHAGHFCHSKLDFDERNLKPQCENCNIWNSGKREYYSAHLEKDYGYGIIQNLITLANCYSHTKKTEYTETWYLEQIELYKNKVDILKKHFIKLYEGN